MAKLTESQIMTRCRQYISDAKEHTIVRSQKDRAERYQDFFRGGTHQWTEEEWNLYKSRGVTPITINRCKPTLKALLGMYLQNKQEIRVMPRRQGSAVVSQVHTEVMKHTQDVSYADYIYCQVFLRGGIDTESYLKLRIDRGMNANGQPVIEGRSLWQIYVDRNAIEYDLNESAKYIIEREWVDQEEVKALYPDKEQEVKAAMVDFDESIHRDRMAERLTTYLMSQGEINGYDEDEAEQIPDSELLKKYRYMLHHVHWKEVIPAMVVGDTQTQEMRVVTDEKTIKNLGRKSKKSVRFKIHRYAAKKLHETVLFGNYLMEDIEEPLGPGVSDYPIVRFSPIWDEGYAMGALDDVVDLNKEENIHRTQMIRLLNQTANSGWIVGSGNNEEYMKKLANYGAIPGVIIDRSKLGDHVEKIQPNQPSSGHFALSQQFEQDIKRVSGVDDASQGYETGKGESGRAINLKIQGNVTSNQIMFSNLYRTMEIFGNMLLKVQLANKFYTDDEIKAIVAESSLIDVKMMAQAKHRFISRLGADLPVPKPLPPIDPNFIANIPIEQRMTVMQNVRQGMEGAEQYAKAYPQLEQSMQEVIKADAILMLLQKLREDKGMYGVRVTVSPYAPTERMSQFLQLDALMKNFGQLIPPDVFIDLMDLPEAKREEMKARIIQQSQAAMPQQVRGAA